MDDIESAVRAALSRVRDPQSGHDIVKAGLVRGLTVRGDRVGFVIEAADGGDGAALAPIRDAAEAAVRAVAGVAQVTAVLTAHAQGGPSPATSRAQTPAKGVQLSPKASAKGRADTGQRANGGAQKPTGVRHILAVASGKGGVGKSTIAANLACAFAQSGLSAGLMDADVYGPSAPILMGLVDADPDIGADKKLVPPQAHGVKVMSMGFLVDTDAPMIWRGPIVTSALNQLLRDVAWGTPEPLDVLVIDLPPGTGDAQLSLIQSAALTGAVIVSTPQELALADVRRGAAMFERTHVPMLGVIENMSAAVDRASGARFAPFGEGGARKAAENLGVPFLGALPLDGELATLSDAGTPPAAIAPDSASGRAFATMSQALWSALEAGPGKQAPRIVFAD